MFLSMQKCMFWLRRQQVLVSDEDKSVFGKGFVGTLTGRASSSGRSQAAGEAAVAWFELFSCKCEQNWTFMMRFMTRAEPELIIYGNFYERRLFQRAGGRTDVRLACGFSSA